MKALGSTCLHDKERATELLKTYFRAIGQADCIYMPRIFQRVVNSPTQRFWVSSQRAQTVIAAMERGASIAHMRSNKREMFTEIYRRVCEFRDSHPLMNLVDIVDEVIMQPV